VTLFFSHHFLHDPRPLWVEIRSRIKPSQILHGGPLGVDYNYRGSELGVVAVRYRVQHAYKLGYRFIFGHAVNPSSAIISLRNGLIIPLPDISLNIKDFTFNGEKPFQVLNLIWKGYEQYNNMDLCAIEFLEDYLAREKQNEEKRRILNVKSSL